VKHGAIQKYCRFHRPPARGKHPDTTIRPIGPDRKRRFGTISETIRGDAERIGSTPMQPSEGNPMTPTTSNTCERIETRFVSLDGARGDGPPIARRSPMYWNDCLRLPAIRDPEWLAARYGHS
jgi:hypothetical protein